MLKMRYKVNQISIVHAIALLAAHCTCAVIGAANAAETDLGTQSGQLSGSAKESDLALIDSLRREIETIPEPDRNRIGVEVLRANIDRLKTPGMRQRVLLSVGDLYAQLDERDDAMLFYRRTIDLKADLKCTYLARKRLASLLTNAGRTQEAMDLLNEGAKPQSDQKVLATPAHPNIDSEGYLLERERIRVLIQSEEFEQALKKCIALLQMYPGKQLEISRLAQEIGGYLRIRGRKQEAIAIYARIQKAFPETNKDPNFCSNYIQLMKETGQNEAVEKASSEFINHFPNNQLTPGYLNTMAEVCLRQGELEKAKEYWQRVLSHPKVRPDYKQAAETNLRDISARTALNPITSSPSSNWRTWAIIGNFIIVFLLLIVTVVRKTAWRFQKIGSP